MWSYPREDIPQTIGAWTWKKRACMNKYWRLHIGRNKSVWDARSITYHISCIELSSQSNLHDSYINLQGLDSVFSVIPCKTTLRVDARHWDKSYIITTCSAENILKASKAKKRKNVGIGVSSVVFSCVQIQRNCIKSEKITHNHDSWTSRKLLSLER